MPEPHQVPQPPVDGGSPDITGFADALVRRVFTVSMGLHQALARLSTPHVDHRRHRQRPERGGQSARHAGPASADRPVTQAEAERLRQALRQAISELDEMIHDIRAVAFTNAIASQAPTTVGPLDGGTNATAPLSAAGRRNGHADPHLRTQVRRRPP
ncbi:hypothetical protein ETD83_03055 [Actinomadura soli]|uniref:Uncharacterized protein n=1 Tax=Actinomadura soli TaxID=2508997 RepID=A0A5C4JJ92_9ACTN|nr:hypothetical protein [Actinomadura soli]TMR06870.1 hypothetical protein ETD83_03055 [Actinomadura soli]